VITSVDFLLRQYGSLDLYFDRRESRRGPPLSTSLSQGLPISDVIKSLTQIVFGVLMYNYVKFKGSKSRVIRIRIDLIIDILVVVAI
jgi:hypothetical protein